jgi:hypothetical protein
MPSEQDKKQAPRKPLWVLVLFSGGMLRTREGESKAHRRPGGECAWTKFYGRLPASMQSGRSRLVVFQHFGKEFYRKGAQGGHVMRSIEAGLFEMIPAGAKEEVLAAISLYHFGQLLGLSLDRGVKKAAVLAKITSPFDSQSIHVDLTALERTERGGN